MRRAECENGKAMPLLRGLYFELRQWKKTVNNTVNNDFVGGYVSSLEIAIAEAEKRDYVTDAFHNKDLIDCYENNFNRGERMSNEPTQNPRQFAYICGCREGYKIALEYLRAHIDCYGEEIFVRNKKEA